MELLIPLFISGIVNYGIAERKGYKKWIRFLLGVGFGYLIFLSLGIILRLLESLNGYFILEQLLKLVTNLS